MVDVSYDVESLTPFTVIQAIMAAVSYVNFCVYCDNDLVEGYCIS